MNIIQDNDFEEAFSHFSFRQDFRQLNAKRRKENSRHKDVLNVREIERRNRENLQSRHGPTAELHDQVR